MRHLKTFEMKFFKISDIDVDSIKPTKKDHERADGLRWQGSTFHGDNSPFRSQASKMAKLIQDPEKLVRRAKAVAQEYGTGREGDRDAWGPFRDALREMGFTRSQIEKIAYSK